MTEEHLPDDAIEFAHQLFDAARAGSLEFVLSAVDAGVPVGLSTQAGDSLLMLAAYHGHAHLVSQLAARGADVNQANDRGQTPLAGAVFKRHDEVVKALIEAGADPDAGAPTARDTARMFGSNYFEN